ncbi:MAG: hypothetical protein JO277_14595 [Candidatus Eremiobacteraeota bacterium]|nr:hypothetical protein [Candidatus Eremiobacteraeota bacterium]
MDREEERREGVTDADATGLIAGEALITDAETMLPIRELHDALPERHEAHETIDRLGAELSSGRPNADAIRHHVGILRSLPQLEARVVNWWDDPKTQQFIADLSQIGL